MTAAAFFRRHVLIHCHIEKTAGSSLVHAFRQWFGDRVLDLRVPGSAAPADLPAGERSRIWVLSGHFAAHVHDHAFARERRHIACLREPAARFQSYVRYVQRDPRHPGFAYFDGKTLAEAAAWAVATGHHAATNPMSRAVEKIARPLLVPQPRLHDLLAHLAPAFGRKPLTPVRNVNPANGALDEDAAAIIRAANQADIALYDAAEKAFDAWLARPGTLSALLHAAPEKAGTTRSSANDPLSRPDPRSNARSPAV
ncbi:MAG: hypothetical protein AAF577_05715 [Pseudomonadota bacterium]